MRRNKFQRAQTTPEVYSKAINVLFLGAANVGKSSLVRRLLGKDFIDDYIPTVYDVFSKEVKHDTGRFIFQITDMSGYYSFPPMRRLAIAHSSIFVLVYEIGNKSSYDEIVRLNDEILEMKNISEIAVIVVGNKVDIIQPGMMKDVEIEDSLISSSYSSLKVSAKTCQSIDDLEACLLNASFSVTLEVNKHSSKSKKSHLQSSRIVAS